MAKTICIFLLCLLSSVVKAETKALTIPLEIPSKFVRGLIYDKLQFDENGVSDFIDGPCQPVLLSKPKIWIKDNLLHLQTDLEADLGVDLLGACFNLSKFNGQLYISMSAISQNQGSEIVFKPESASLFKDGVKEGVRSSLLEYIAENQILPHLKTIKIDVSKALTSLNDVINDWTDGEYYENPDLNQRSRIGTVFLNEKGLNADLIFSVNSNQQSIQEPALTEEEYKAWQSVEDELDGFITYIVVNLLKYTMDINTQSDLMTVLLDTRYAIANALLSESKTISIEQRSDRIRQLFIDAWEKLRPFYLTLAPSRYNESNMYQLFGFIAGADALKALDSLGPEYGVEISKDGLRRLARTLLGNDAPASFTPLSLETDPFLLQLFGASNIPIDLPEIEAFQYDGSQDIFLDDTNTLENNTLPSSTEQETDDNSIDDKQDLNLQNNQIQNDVKLNNAWDNLDSNAQSQSEKELKEKELGEQIKREENKQIHRPPHIEEPPDSSKLLLQNNRSTKIPYLHTLLNNIKPFDWYDAFINSANANQKRYRGLVKDSSNIEEYINISNKFFDIQIDTFFKNEHKIPDQFIGDFKLLIRSTAWKESCWRQYTGSSDKPKLLTSGAGAIGMMQINERVWRGIYDVDKLKNSVAYNLYAGSKILEYYFVDFALRKKEHEKGNPFAATYAAYNGGPGHLTRYRKLETSENLKAIDNAFSKIYEHISKNGVPDIKECYSG